MSIEEPAQIPEHELGHFFLMMQRYPPLRSQADFERLYDQYLNAEGIAERLQARDLITYGNVGLVLKQALRLRGYGISLQDLAQCGLMAITFKALPKYELERGTRFSTYASWWVRSSMTRAIQDERSDLATRVPAYQYESRYRLKRIWRQFVSKYHRAPGPDELIEALGLKGDPAKNRKTVEDIFTQEQIFARPVSLDKPLGDDGADERSMHELFAAENQAPSNYAPRLRMLPDPSLRKSIEKLLNVLLNLDPRRLDILVSRFAHGETLNAIGERHGRSRERIRQLQEEGCMEIGIALHIGKWQAKEALTHLADCIDLSELLPERRGPTQLDNIAPATLKSAFDVLGEHAKYGSKPAVVPQPSRVLELRLELSSADARRLMQGLAELGWLEDRDGEAVLLRYPLELEEAFVPRADRIEPLPKATWAPCGKRESVRHERGMVLAQRNSEAQQKKIALSALLAHAVQVMGERYVRGAAPVLQRECRFHCRRAEELLGQLTESGEIAPVDGWRMIKIGNSTDVAAFEDVVCRSVPSEAPVDEHASDEVPPEALPPTESQEVVEPVDTEPSSQATPERKKRRYMYLPQVLSCEEEWTDEDGERWISDKALKTRLERVLGIRLGHRRIRAWLREHEGSLYVRRVRDENGKTRRLYVLRRLHSALSFDVRMRFKF